MGLFDFFGKKGGMPDPDVFDKFLELDSDDDDDFNDEDDEDFDADEPLEDDEDYETTVSYEALEKELNKAVDNSSCFEVEEEEEEVDFGEEFDVNPNLDAKLEAVFDRVINRYIEKRADEMMEKYRENEAERKKKEKEYAEQSKKYLEIIEKRNAEAKEDKDVYIYCGVNFPKSTYVYHYRTNDKTIEIGDEVIVDTMNGEVQATVVSVGHYRKHAVPYPVEKAKFIKCRANEKNEQS